MFQSNLNKMFFLTLLEHTIRIPPESLNVPLLQAITVELQNLFVDKVIKDLGLCISIYDIHSLEGGFVFAGDGAPTFTIEFRLVMFRPFVGEVLVGKLKKCDKRGIYLSLGFFDDIHVPEHLLQQPSVFNEEENLWMWDYQGSEMFMDLDEEVRFRVSQLKYLPIPVEQENDSKPFAPMEIISISEQGHVSNLATQRQYIVHTQAIQIESKSAASRNKRNTLPFCYKLLPLLKSVKSSD